MTQPPEYSTGSALDGIAGSLGFIIAVFIIAWCITS